MAKRKEIKVTCWFMKENGDVVPLESLTPEEKADAERKMRKRLTESMSRYFAARPPEDYIKFVEALEAEEKRRAEEKEKAKQAG